MVLVDGTAGTVIVTPDSASADQAVEAARQDAERAAGWSGPGATSDGHAVAVLANVQDGAAARAARDTAAEGIGLFRTELCFLNRETEPTVDEQTDIYAEVLDAFAGHKVVVRTLDAGSDKPLKFAEHPNEANPRSVCAASASRASTRRCWTVNSRPLPLLPSAPATRRG